MEVTYLHCRLIGFLSNEKVSSLIWFFLPTQGMRDDDFYLQNQKFYPPPRNKKMWTLVLKKQG